MFGLNKEGKPVIAGENEKPETLFNEPIEQYKNKHYTVIERLNLIDEDHLKIKQIVSDFIQQVLLDMDQDKIDLAEMKKRILQIEKELGI